jgi:hypothetical protein
MTTRELTAVMIGLVLGIGLISVVGKIYVDNLHYVACKMYNTVDNQFSFEYVNKQFRCTKDKE